TAARSTAAAGARGAGSVSAAYSAGAAGKSGAGAVGSGLANVARTAASGAASPLRRAAEKLRTDFDAGRSGSAESAAPSRPADGPPAWAAAMRRRQMMTQGATIGAHTLKGGDSHGGGSAPDISEKD
ncbi:MAG: P-type conjugative transfer protein TrbL, partial [Sphingopyxis granuli]